jgi:hypothetical protein
MLKPVTVEDWNGMWNRGIADSAPNGYFQDSLNVKFNDSDVLTRDGSIKVLTQSNIVRFFMYKRLGETPRIIYLTTTGQLYDSLFPGTPIWTDATFLDFSLINFNNRAYITPHNRVTGIAGKFVLVYDGSGTARLAGGAAPTGFTLGITEPATSGKCEAGIHLVAIVFESSSGFLSAPGPAIYGQITSTGGHTIDLSAVQVGGVGTVARRIVATKAIQSYNGNQNGYQFYLVGSANGGRIPNNTATTWTGQLSFYDSDLTVTADYLFDNRPFIPAGTCIGQYSGRMFVGGINGDEHTLYLSKSGEPEQFDSVAGFISTNPFDSASGIKNAFTFRNNLTIAKSNRTYATTDNGGDPISWNEPVEMDNGVGTECFGISTILDSKGQQTDRAYVAHASGLMIYEGYYRRPELSWVVADTWKRITASVFNLIQICVDTTNSAVYVSVPLDGSTSISHILYGYYGTAYGRYGFDPKLVKWSLWQFQPGTKSICVDINSSNQVVFKYAGTVGNIYDMLSDYSVHSDDGNAFASYVQMSLYTARPKWINQLSLIGIRVQGLGTLVNTVSGIDGGGTTTLQPITMTASPGFEKEIKANFQNERVAPKFATGANVNEYFKISRADLYITPLWRSRPA